MKNESLPTQKGKFDHDIDRLRQDIRMMGKVLAVLPMNGRDRPNGARASWPDFHQDQSMYSAKNRYKASYAPSPREISQADRLLQLVMVLDEVSRRIVMARAMGVPWRRLEEMDGRSHTTLRKIESSALLTLIKSEVVQRKERKINS
jgi:hypothetical protein